MKLFENKVGRPSNEILKKRRNFYIIAISIAIVMISGITLSIPGVTKKLFGAAASPSVTAYPGTSSGSAANKNVIVQWKNNGWGAAQQFTIYLCNDGSACKSLTKKEKHEISKKTSISGTWELKGFKNNSWYLASVNFKNGKSTLNPSVKFYTHSDYNVTYSVNGGNGSVASTKGSFINNYTLSKTVPTKTGYTFNCWNVSTWYKNKTLYYTGKGWSESPSNGCLKPGQSISPVFILRYNISNATKQAINLKAQWTPNSYTIIYNADGGTGSVSSTSAKYDSNATLQKNTFKKQGYIQIGWCYDSGCTKVYNLGASVKNLTTANNGKVTFYARWAVQKKTEQLGDSSSNKNKIYQYFRNKGISKVGVSALMGNLQAESGFEPTTKNSGGCYGIVQWCDRRSNLESYARKNGMDYTKLNTQLDFIWYEFNNGYKSTYNYIKSATDISSATNYFCNNYERPGTSVCAESTRRNFAQNIYNSVKTVTVNVPVKGTGASSSTPATTTKAPATTVKTTAKATTKAATTTKAPAVSGPSTVIISKNNITISVTYASNSMTAKVYTSSGNKIKSCTLYKQPASSSSSVQRWPSASANYSNLTSTTITKSGLSSKTGYEMQCANATLGTVTGLKFTTK